MNQATRDREEVPVVSTEPHQAATTGRALPRRTASWLGRAGVDRLAFAVSWIAVVAALSIALPNSYPTMANVSTMLASQASLLILALAALISLTTGDFDLSLASVAGLSAVLVAVLDVQYHVPIALAVLIAVLAAAAVGLVNALLVVRVGADSIVVTLGMGTFLVGVITWLSKSSTVSGVDPLLVDWVVVRRLFEVPLAFFYALGLCLLIWYVQGFTALGQRMLFVGQGPEVARLSGIRVDLIRGASLVSGSVMAALAGVVTVGMSGAADPANAPALLLPAFAAAFLGSAALGRGRFSAWSCLLAVYFLVSGITGLQQLGAQSYVQNLFYGGALVIAVITARFARRRAAAAPKGLGR